MVATISCTPVALQLSNPPILWLQWPSGPSSKQSQQDCERS